MRRSEALQGLRPLRRGHGANGEHRTFSAVSTVASWLKSWKDAAIQAEDRCPGTDNRIVVAESKRQLL